MDTKTTLDDSTVKYCLYARKSTEQDELQALSIDSQIKEMMEMAIKENMTITEIRKESHSAKDSGQRPVFNQLLEDVKSGMFQGILCWAPDRLSRNAGDLGRIVDLMDQGKLVGVKTHGQKFTNNPNEKFLLMILGSQAKLENDNKSLNVQRGLRAKCEKGWRPCPPPLGYIHDKYGDKGSKRIFLDPKRAHIIKQMFERVAYENFSGKKILKWLMEIGFKTRKGKNPTLSTIFQILHETFYYGEFEYPIGSNKWYKGLHDPIISKELFIKVRDRYNTFSIENKVCREFAFTKLMKCGLCGSGITAEEKFKKLSDGSVVKYIYYGCTRGSDRFCKGGYIREEELVKQLVDIVDKLEIDNIGIQKQFEEELQRYTRFNKGFVEINNKKIKQKEFSINDYAKYILKSGTMIEKRELMSCFKSSLILKDKKIGIYKNV